MARSHYLAGSGTTLDISRIHSIFWVERQSKGYMIIVDPTDCFSGLIYGKSFEGREAWRERQRVGE